MSNPTAAPPVAGPIGIATQIGDIFFRAGPILTLYVAAVLSANLALVNILPFPPLDGGRMLMIVLKSVFGARISLRAERLTYVVGFAVLFAFLIWVSGFDIARILERQPDVGSADAARPTPSARGAGRPSASTSAAFSSARAHPIVVQSMTNTDTADPDATAIQVARLAHAGSQLVRVTVNTEEAAAAVPEMMRKLRGLGVDVPVIGDFHYNGHKLLVEYPEMAAALAKYRINPGNVGAKRHDEHFATIVKVAIDNGKPVRIGVNWGSLDQQLLTELMNENAATAEPRDARDVMIEAMIESAMRSAELAEETGLGHDRIIISAKVSQVRDLVDVYRLLAAAVRLPAPPRADRGRPRRQGDRRVDGRPRDPAERGDRRHDPRLADAGSRRAARARGRDRPAGPPVDGHPLVPAAGQRLPRLRPDDVDVLPGDGPADPDLPEGRGCPSGRRRARASRTCGSRSWAAS